MDHLKVMKIVGSIYTLIILATTLILGKRRLTRNEQPLMWLTVLILASLRSPFLPSYGLFPVLWLLILMAATVIHVSSGAVSWLWLPG